MIEYVHTNPVRCGVFGKPTDAVVEYSYYAGIADVPLRMDRIAELAG